MADLLRQVALVSETTSVVLADLTRTSAALQNQASRDFGPVWNLQATVDAFDKLEDVPLGYWPVIIRDDIQESGALGVHLDKDNQPFALVQFTDSWQLTVSHETLEMLCDPFGNRLLAGDSPKQDQGRVEFLVEVCDPCEAADFGYTVNGITVSDFYTPAYFDPVKADGVRYSFTGALTAPRQVLRGGYLSWHEPVTDHWWQEIFFDNQPEFRDLGGFTQGRGSLRAQIERLTYPLSKKSLLRNKDLMQAAARSFGQRVARPSATKAQSWRAQIEELKRSTRGAAAGPALDPAPQGGPPPSRRKAK